MALILRYAARSDVGLVRSANEDSGYAGSRMLVVADGMGGHAAGELASATAVAVFADLDVQKDLKPDDDEVLGLLASAIDEAHETLGGIATEHPEARGMGTTITALAWLNTKAAIAHIGDSRAYRLRDGVLTQLTHDHTFVQTLVDSGQITSEEAAVHAKRNLLTRALDGLHDVESDLSVLPVRPGDRFLLCTDGLHGVLADSEIAELLASPSDPTGIVGALVDRALAGGAPDNVTALVADVVEVPDAGVEPETTQMNELSPVVVGAAAERGNRERLPGVVFPDDEEPAPDTVTTDPGDATEPPPAAVSVQSNRNRRSIRLLPIIAVVAVIGVLLAAWAWTRSQYYVGEYEGSVAVFQGIPQGPGPNGFSTVEEVSAVEVGQLPEFEREKLQARIPAENPQDALRIVAALAAAAERCAGDPRPAGCPPVDSTTVPTAPTASATPSPAAPAIPSPTPAEVQ